MLSMLSVLSSSKSFFLTSTPTVSDEFVYGRMSGIARYLYDALGKVDEVTGAVNYDVAGYVLLAITFLLSALVYKLGFAKKLPLWQNVIIYVFLFLGCIMLTFFAFFLPIVEGLIVAALILIVYKTRLWREKREEKQQTA
jgi:hypothetical protein